MSQEPILKKNLLKTVLADPMNSAQDPQKKKKKKHKRKHLLFSVQSKHTLSVSLNTTKIQLGLRLRFKQWVPCIVHEPISLEFGKINSKPGSHVTIHTFKNYFTTVFSVFSNKRYPNIALNE